MKWFTSDWHLSHEKLSIKGRNFSTTKEHDETIVNNLFETLKPGDDLYFLGDAFWKYSSKDVEQLMTKFKKHRISIYWIIGNHDKLSWTKHNAVKWYGQIKDIIIDKQPITLCHYPLLVYNKSHYSGWMLYGHLHYNDNTWKKLYNNSVLENYLGKALNVNVELYDFKPINFEYIKSIMNEKPDNFDLITKETAYDK